MATARATTATVTTCARRPRPRVRSRTTGAALPRQATSVGEQADRADHGEGAGAQGALRLDTLGAPAAGLDATRGRSADGGAMRPLDHGVFRPLQRRRQMKPTPTPGVIRRHRGEGAPR